MAVFSPAVDNFFGERVVAVVTPGLNHPSEGGEGRDRGGGGERKRER